MIKRGAISLLTFLAGAAIAAPDPTKDLQNLIYYPHARESFFSFNFQYSLNDTGVNNNRAGTPTNATNVAFNQISATYLYGISNRFRIGITETDLLNDVIQTTSDSTGVTTTDNAQGLSSPTLHADWRFVKDREDDFYMDALVSVTPTVATHYAATGDQEGDDFAGGWNATVSFPFYKAWPEDGNEFEMSPSITHFFGGATVDPASFTETTPYWYGTLTITDRYHFTNSFYVQPSFGMIFDYSYTSTNSGTGNPVTVMYNYYLTPSLTAGYLASAHWLFTLALNYTTDNHSTNPQGGSPKTNTSNESVLSLTAIHTF